MQFDVMKNKNIFITPFLDKRNKELNNNLFFISIMIGASVGYYFLKKYMVKKTLNKGIKHFENSLNDIPTTIKNSTENSLRDVKPGNNPIKINLPEAGRLNWRKNREKSMFPPIPDPNIRIN